MKKLFAFAFLAGVVIATVLFVYPGRDLWGAIKVMTLIPALAILAALILGGWCVWVITRGGQE